MANPKKTCFVIMPFSDTTSQDIHHTEDYWTDHFERVLKPVIEENENLIARRSNPLRGDILKQIITDLVTSPIVVADLTDARPNVYWELGVRQSFKHGTVTIAQKDTRLHFDLGAKGTLFYEKEPAKWETFRRRFKQAITDCLENPDVPDSHVLEALSGRGSLFETFRRQEAIGRLDALLDEIRYNQNLTRIIADEVEKVLAKEQPGLFPTSFNLASLELLITTRYVDEDPTFYTVAAGTYNVLQTANSGMNHPVGSPAHTAHWIQSSAQKHVVETLGELKSKVSQARQRLIA
jgi:hypothetical protein